jgi:hypothetical protein
VQAGIPVSEEGFKKTEIEGIPFFVIDKLADSELIIHWVGFWVFGRFVVEKN